jgi:hypothetical protein
MANSIRNNAEFRAMLMRKNGATGKELQALTGRAYIYSAWSLVCMNTDTHSIYTLKDGKETRYMLLNDARVAANEQRKAENAARKLEANKNSKRKSAASDASDNTSSANV